MHNPITERTPSGMRALEHSTGTGRCDAGRAPASSASELQPALTAPRASSLPMHGGGDAGRQQPEQRRNGPALPDADTGSGFVNTQVGQRPGGLHEHSIRAARRRQPNQRRSVLAPAQPSPFSPRPVCGAASATAARSLRSSSSSPSRYVQNCGTVVTAPVSTGVISVSADPACWESRRPFAWGGTGPCVPERLPMHATSRALARCAAAANMPRAQRVLTLVERLCAPGRILQRG